MGGLGPLTLRLEHKGGDRSPEGSPQQGSAAISERDDHIDRSTNYPTLLIDNDRIAICVDPIPSGGDQRSRSA
jgi:hypothetical protein